MKFGCSVFRILNLFLKILEMSYGSLIASYGSLIASNGNPIASNCIVWQSTRHQGPRPPRPKVPRPKAPGPRHQAHGTRPKAPGQRHQAQRIKAQGTKAQGTKGRRHQRPKTPGPRHLAKAQGTKAQGTNAQGTRPKAPGPATKSQFRHCWGCPCYGDRWPRAKPVQKGERYQHSKLVIIWSYDSTSSRHNITLVRHANIGCSTPRSAHLGMNLNMDIINLYLCGWLKAPTFKK